MRDVTVRQMEMTNRVAGFLRDNPIVFRKGSPGAELINQFRKQVEEVHGLTAAQVSEIAQTRAYTRSRAVNRESLEAALEELRLTADAIAITVPGLQAKFKPIGRVADSKLETQARALIESARPYEKKFVDYEMESDFIRALESKLHAFSESVVSRKASRAAHVATSHQIGDAMERTLTTLGQLDPIIRNKFRGNTGLKLKWENARHIERRWVYRKAEEAAPESEIAGKTPTPDAPVVPVVPAA